MFGATAAAQLLQRRRPRRLGYVRDVQPGRRAALEALPPVLALLSGNMSVHAVHAIRGPHAYPEGDTSYGACVSRVPCSQPASKTGRQACVGASCGRRRECGVRCARAGGERRATARTSSATATTRSAVYAERRDDILGASRVPSAHKSGPKLVVESESEPTPG